jgi:hypothetical protein
MNHNTLNALQEAYHYVQLMVDSAAPADDGERALLARINAAIEEQVRYIPIVRLTREEFEAAAAHHALDHPELTDDDLSRIARKMTDALFENGFWEILNQVVGDYIENALDGQHTT